MYPRVPLFQISKYANGGHPRLRVNADIILLATHLIQATHNVVCCLQWNAMTQQ